jgi:hypothetical protein
MDKNIYSPLSHATLHKPLLRITNTNARSDSKTQPAKKLKYDTIPKTPIPVQKKIPP